MPNLGQKLSRTWKNFELPQYRLHTDLSKEAYAENLAKIASELSILEPILWGKFFVPNLWQILYTPQKNFVLPQYSLHTDSFKEAYAENLAKIASELSILEPI